MADSPNVQAAGDVTSLAPPIQHFEEELYFNPQDFLVQLEVDLRAAKQTVDIEMYIWGADELTGKFEAILFELIQRQVKVRLLVDGMGSYTWVRQRMMDVMAGGVDVRVFHPLPAFGFFRRVVPKLSVLLTFLNRRTHRKAIIIDKKIAYIGSFNLMELALDWRETVVRLTTASVGVVHNLFEDAWNYKPRFRRILRGERYHQPIIHDDCILSMRRFVELIKVAKYRVWMTTPYFNPPRYLMKALIKAAKRGVEVRLILPEHVDISVMRWVAQQHYARLCRAKVKLYEYKPRFLHAKTAIIDDQGVIGSGNLNHRSFLKDLELNVILRSQTSLLQLEAQYEKDAGESNRIDNTFVVSFWKRLIDYLVTPFKDSL